MRLQGGLPGQLRAPRIRVGRGGERFGSGGSDLKGLGAFFCPGSRDADCAVPARAWDGCPSPESGCFPPAFGYGSLRAGERTRSQFAGIWPENPTIFPVVTSFGQKTPLQRPYRLR